MTEIIKALRISDVDVKQISIGEKKDNKIPVFYKGKSLVFQTPFLEVKESLRKTTSNHIYQLDTFLTADTIIKNNYCLEFLETLETVLSAEVAEKGTHWFNGDEINLKTLIREIEPTDSKSVYHIKWPVNLKLKIFVDETKNAYNSVNLKPKDLVKMIVEIAGLWVIGNDFGLVTVVHKIMVKPHVEKLRSEYIFNDEEVVNINDDENTICSMLATDKRQQNKVKHTKLKKPAIEAGGDHRSIKTSNPPVTSYSTDENIEFSL